MFYGGDQFGAKRITVDIAGNMHQILCGIDMFEIIPALEEMTSSFPFFVGGAGVVVAHGLHERSDTEGNGLMQQEVEMIRHQTISDDTNGMRASRLFHQLDEEPIVLRGEVDLRAGDTAVIHMKIGVLQLQKSFSVAWHAVKLHTSGGGVT